MSELVPGIAGLTALACLLVPAVLGAMPSQRGGNRFGVGAVSARAPREDVAPRRDGATLLTFDERSLQLGTFHVPFAIYSPRWIPEGEVVSAPGHWRGWRAETVIEPLRQLLAESRR